MAIKTLLPIQIARKTKPQPTGALPRSAAGRLGTTVRLHRDPLGFLRASQRRLGDVFVLSLTTGTQIVVADPSLVQEIAGSDPSCSHAGSARRGMLPMASPRSVFGGDTAEHDAARDRVESVFTPEASAERADAISRTAERHIRGWPRGRPFRLLPRMRLLADEVFTKEVLGVQDEDGAREIARAIGRLLWTPGNPPLAIPARDQGLLGPLVDLAYQRRLRPLAALLHTQLKELRKDQGERSGVLGLLLDAEPDASDGELVDELLALLMAAQEPMASALTWIALCTAGDRAVQDRLAAETIGSTYGQAVVKEALRLHPPAIAMLRRLDRPMVLAGHELPAEATVMVPIVLLHRDARAFDAPDEFQPERHLQGEPSGPLLAFGAGSRSCLGQWLARTEIAMVLPVMLDALRLQAALPSPERMVLRATILVPQRSGLVIARSASGGHRR